MRTGLLVLVASVSVLCAPAWPQGAEPDNADGRFTLYRTEGGFLRLDGRSGEVSACSKRGAGWLCEALPEERAALEAEIARLQGDNAALKKVLLGHGLPLPTGISSDPSASAAPAAPSNVDRLKSLIGSAWRRLVAMVSSVQRDLRGRS